MLDIGALAVAFRGLHELLARDPAVLVGDFLHDRDRKALRALDCTHAPINEPPPRRKHTNSWKSKACQVRRKPHCPQP